MLSDRQQLAVSSSHCKHVSSAYSLSRSPPTAAPRSQSACEFTRHISASLVAPPIRRWHWAPALLGSYRNSLGKRLLLVREGVDQAGQTDWLTDWLQGKPEQAAKQRTRVKEVNQLKIVEDKLGNKTNKRVSICFFLRIGRFSDWHKSHWTISFKN